MGRGFGFAAAAVDAICGFPLGHFNIPGLTCRHVFTTFFDLDRIVLILTGFGEMLRFTQLKKSYLNIRLLPFVTSNIYRLHLYINI